MRFFRGADPAPDPAPSPAPDPAPSPAPAPAPAPIPAPSQIRKADESSIVPQTESLEKTFENQGGALRALQIEEDSAAATFREVARVQRTHSLVRDFGAVEQLFRDSCPAFIALYIGDLEPKGSETPGWLLVSHGGTPSATSATNASRAALKKFLGETSFSLDKHCGSAQELELKKLVTKDLSPDFQQQCSPNCAPESLKRAILLRPPSDGLVFRESASIAQTVDLQADFDQLKTRLAADPTSVGTALLRFSSKELAKAGLPSLSPNWMLVRLLPPCICNKEAMGLAAHHCLLKDGLGQRNFGQDINCSSVEELTVLHCLQQQDRAVPAASLTSQMIDQMPVSQEEAIQWEDRLSRKDCGLFSSGVNSMTVVIDAQVEEALKKLQQGICNFIQMAVVEDRVGVALSSHITSTHLLAMMAVMEPV